MNWEMIQGKNGSKAKSSSFMQTFIFSMFILDLYQRIKFNLYFEVRDESHKDFLSSFLGEELLHPCEGFWMCSLHKTSQGKATDWEENWVATMRIPNGFIIPNYLITT